MLKLFGLAAIGRQKLPNGSATNDDHHDGTDSEVEMVAFDGDGAPLGLQEASSGVRKAVRPSSRALGKRKAPPSPDRTSLRSSGVGSGKRRHATDHALEGAATLDGAGTVSGGGIVAKAPSPKKKKKEEEKRMTRSSYARGGGGELQGDTWTRRKRSDSSDSENGWVPPPPLLPPTTVLHFTTAPVELNLEAPPQDVVHPLDAAATAHLGSTSSNGPAVATEDPSFRLLSEAELLPPGRTRGLQASPTKGPGGVPLDADAHFQRLHRFPEVLEKRSKRREKERLIHARFNLRATLDALKNTSDGKTVRSIVAARWKEEAAMGVQSSAGNAGTGTELERLETTRQVMMKEIHETLKRYDALLEPRKESSFTRGDSATSLSDRAASPAPSSQRSESPAPSVVATPSSSRHGRFGGAVYGNKKRGRPCRPSAKQIGPTKGVVNTASGLALRILFRGPGGQFSKSPRGRSKAISIPDHVPVGSKRSPRRGRGARVAAIEDGSDPDGNDGDVADVDSDYGAPIDPPAEGSEASQSFADQLRPRRPKPPAMSTRIRDQDSFFDSPALRSAVVAQFGAANESKGKAPTRRRASARVQHAFGARVPDSPTLFPMAPLPVDFDLLQADPLAIGTADVEELQPAQEDADALEGPSLAALVAARHTRT